MEYKKTAVRESLSTSCRGVATLPTVMVLGVMSLAVAVGLTSVALTESYISQGFGQSSKALFYAEAGARDALMKIARNKNYTYTTGEGYLIDFAPSGCSLGTDCAKVLVSAGDGTTATPKIITSKGVMKASSRTLEVQVVFDGGTGDKGEITSATWREVTN